jgi:hypothetical protein
MRGSNLNYLPNGTERTQRRSRWFTDFRSKFASRLSLTKAVSFSPKSFALELGVAKNASSARSTFSTESPLHIFERTRVAVHRQCEHQSSRFRLVLVVGAPAGCPKLPNMQRPQSSDRADEAGFGRNPWSSWRLNQPRNDHPSFRARGRCCDFHSLSSARGGSGEYLRSGR